MLRQVSRIRPSIESACSVARTASVSTKAEKLVANNQVKGNPTEPVTYDWVYDPVTNPRLMNFEGLGSGMDLDQPDYPYNSTTVYEGRVSTTEGRVSVEWHAQPPEELLARDEGL